MSRTTTIAQLARALSVDVNDVSKAARQILSLPSGHARDPQFKLSPHQRRRISAHACHYPAGGRVRSSRKGW